MFVQNGNKTEIKVILQLKILSPRYLLKMSAIGSETIVSKTKFTSSAEAYLQQKLQNIRKLSDNSQTVPQTRDAIVNLAENPVETVADYVECANVLSR